LLANRPRKEQFTLSKPVILSEAGRFACKSTAQSKDLVFHCSQHWLLGEFSRHNLCLGDAFAPVIRSGTALAVQFLSYVSCHSERSRIVRLYLSCHSERSRIVRLRMILRS